ncbi:MAG: DUF2442 domain-containing protein [Pseudomonadota bacterium]
MSSTDKPVPEQQPVAAWCDPDSLIVRLKDGRQIRTPLWWYPSLLAATPAARNAVELMFDGVHWPEIDEDLSVRGMLLGCKAKGAIDPEAAKSRETEEAA